MKTFLSAGRPIRKYGLYLLVLTGLIMLCVAVIGLLLPEKKGPRVLIFYWEEFASHAEVRIAGAEALADVCSENGMLSIQRDEAVCG